MWFSMYIYSGTEYLESSSFGRQMKGASVESASSGYGAQCGLADESRTTV